jgi:cation diffusion facilitator family transporter
MNMLSTQSHKLLSRKETRAMNISLTIGILMFGIKWYAYHLTGSIAIFSDAMETIVHIAAVGFASYSLRVTYRPPDEDHHFGHDKISYFSAGLEGGLIILAAFVIIYTAIDKLIVGITLEKVTQGTFLTGFAGAVNALLGWFLVRTGTRERSLIVTANGKHILTDAWTSIGAIIGLVLAQATGLTWIDPLAALIFGGNIVFEGVKLIRRAADGLMDKTNPELEQKVRVGLEEFCKDNSISFHRFRMRESGQQIYADFHLQFQDGTPIEDCHTIATAAEDIVEKLLFPIPVDVTSHLESNDHPPGHT